MLEDFKFLEHCEAYGTKEACDAARMRIQKQAEARHPGKSYAFVGVNPPVGQYSLKSLYDFAVDKYPYQGIELVVEQHTEQGIRPHLHILHPLSDNGRKNHVITRLANLFKVEKQCIDVSVSRSSIVISRWRSYVHGEKRSEKLSNVEKDIKDRVYYNIPHIYRQDGTSGQQVLLEAQQEGQAHASSQAEGRTEPS